MPVVVTYPGVYIEEIPSGAHTITGVATSITAFMGRAFMGPVATDLDGGPMTIFSFADYQRYFGGLSRDYPMSYAVQDFFLNGGSQAVIARIAGAASPPATRAQLPLIAPFPSPISSPHPAPPSPWVSTGALVLEAANPGTWANGTLFAQVDINGVARAVPNYSQYGVTQADLFNLTIFYQPINGPSATERFINLSVVGANNPNRIDRVLLAQSAYVRAVGPLPTTTPAGWLADWDYFNTYDKPSTPAAEIAQLPSASGGLDSAPLVDTDYILAFENPNGPAALDNVDIFNLLCLPPDSLDTTLTSSDIPVDVWEHAAQYCVNRRAMLIIDSPVLWTTQAKNGKIDPDAIQTPTYFDLNAAQEQNSMIFFPRVVEADPMMKGQTAVFPPCGIIAGLIATTDLQRGVWKAPAGIDTTMGGVVSLDFTMTDNQNGQLNPVGINCLRSFPIIGPVIWGARTLRGADVLEDDYKYIPVRRLTLYIEESLYRGTKWAVFEPNDQTLWDGLRVMINTFMADLQRQGAFYSYFVKCDSSTTTQNDIDNGIVNVLVGFAPVKPAEFVVIQIQQVVGQSS
jgi:phage tail sheath protein FI